MYPFWNYETHCDVIGPSQVGKTSLMLDIGRERILAGKHEFRLSGKSDMYKADVAFTATARPDYKVELLNPSDCDPILPYNFFGLPKGRNLSAHASRVAKVLLQTVSNQPLAELQNYVWAAEPFLAHLALSGEPLIHAMRLFENPKLWARLEVPEQFHHAIHDISKTPPSKWDYKIGALQRRLRPFITSDALRKFASGPGGIEIGDLFKTRTSLFVNASPSRFLDTEAAQIFNGLVLSDILQYGIENAANRGDTYLDCDEIQEYAPANFSSLIDLVLGAGIKITTIHHYGNQLDERDKRLQESLDNNARIKVLFGGLSQDIREKFAAIAWPHLLNKDWHRQPQLTTVTEYEEDLSESITEGDFGHSVTTAPRLIPQQGLVQTGWDDYSLLDKRSKLAARFLVPDRTYHAIFPDGRVRKSAFRPCARTCIPARIPYDL